MSNKLGCHSTGFKPTEEYAQLCRYINSNAIPDLICVPNDTLTQKELNNLDLVAMHHMPNDMPANLAPLQTGTDGNCFPRTVSNLLFKTQERYTEIRVRLIYEAVKNIEHYLDDNYVSIGAHNFYSHGTFPEQYAQYSDNFNPYVTFNMTRLYKTEVMDITNDSAYVVRRRGHLAPRQPLSVCALLPAYEGNRHLRPPGNLGHRLRRPRWID